MSQILPPAQIMQVATGFWASKALLSAVELDVFSTLAEGPMDAETLRGRLGLHDRSARDFFDALVGLGMLERVDGEYTNTPETARYLDRAQPSYIGGFLEMMNNRLYGFWGALTEGLRTGLPQNEARDGRKPFEAIYEDPAAVRAFLAAMTGLSMGSAMAIAERFPWQDHTTMIDVGGAQGGLAVQVARRHEHIMGGVFDLPAVQPAFAEYVGSFGLEERLRFLPGNFFTDSLPQADVLVMGHILHDWNEVEKQMLIAKAYDALPDGGAFIVYGTILDPDRRYNIVGLLNSLNMLIETEGGAEYTGPECEAWMRDAGFRDTRVELLDGPESMVVGVK